MKAATITSRLGRRTPEVALRLALGISFLSAVADRFGLWGPAGAPHVAWGDFNHFLIYTSRLLRVFPPHFVRYIGWIATVAEAVLGTALVLGVRVRESAYLSGALLSLFALAMLTSLGPKPPLDASVFTAAAAALVLGNLQKKEQDPVRIKRTSKSRDHREATPPVHIGSEAF